MTKKRNKKMCVVCGAAPALEGSDRCGKTSHAVKSAVHKRDLKKMQRQIRNEDKPKVKEMLLGALDAWKKGVGLGDERK